MYAITGATGNTGRVIAEKLLANGKQVRVIGRDTNRLAHFLQKGAEAIAADLTDPVGLARAFEGSRAAYVLVPPSITSADVRAYQERVTDALVAALEKAAVPYVAALSSVGADQADKTGPVVGLHNLEQKLNGLANLNALYIRAGYFMENLLPQVAVIQNFGFVGGPLRADLRVPMIATRDIGSVAADLLLKLEFAGKQARELLGHRDLTYTEVTSVIGKAIASPNLAYVQLSAQQLKPGLMQMGMSSNMADLLLEMSEALNSGYMASLEPRSERNTTPTSIETFVTEELVPRFQAKGACA
jgi:uncharacterized protein YbjT (DUF2867 family)